jgi:hypothetical protein
MTCTDEEAPIDRHRDRIMFISRNEHMDGSLQLIAMGGWIRCRRRLRCFIRRTAWWGLQEQSELLGVSAPSL